VKLRDVKVKPSRFARWQPVIRASLEMSEDLKEFETAKARIPDERNSAAISLGAENSRHCQFFAEFSSLAGLGKGLAPQ
jgi:hypothetical protein